MKILSINGTIMVHLEADEAIALANALDPSNSEVLAKMTRKAKRELFTEIVRQIDICLNANRGQQ